MQRRWTQAACLAFGLATLFALAVVALRLPAWQADHREAFRIALLLHVNLAVFVWLAITMASQWAGSLGARAWRGPIALVTGGTVLLALSPVAGGQAVMADYFPWLSGNPLFAAGFGLVSAGVLLVAVQRLATPSDPADPSSAPLRLAAWPAVFSAAAAGTTSMAGGNGIDIAWAAGHTILFAHVAMLCHEWTVHGQGDPQRSERAVRVLAATSALLALLPLVSPPGSAGFRWGYTLSMMGVLCLPPLWVAIGLRGRTPPPDAPQATNLALALSISFFALGCLLGVAVALSATPTTLVTAHYHAAMGAVVISRMGMAYRQAGAPSPAEWPASRRQLATYAAALVLLTAGLSIAAVEGAPRKTSASEHVAKGPWYRTGMSVAGAGGTLALVGTVWLIVNLLGKPRRTTAPPAALPLATLPLRRRELPNES